MGAYQEFMCFLVDPKCKVSLYFSLVLPSVRLLYYYYFSPMCVPLNQFHCTNTYLIQA